VEESTIEEKEREEETKREREREREKEGTRRYLGVACYYEEG